MNLICKARQMELGTQLQTYMEKRFQKLTPYLTDDQNVEVEILHEENKALAEPYQVTAIVWFGGQFEKVQKHAADPIAAIDQVANTLVRRIREDNKKRWQRSHAGGNKSHHKKD